MGTVVEHDEYRVEDSSIEPGKEDGNSPAEGSQEITIRGRDSGDYSLESESPEIIGHLTGAVVIRTDSQKSSHLYPESAVGESIEEMDKQAECQE